MITEQRELSRAGASEKAAFTVLSVKPPDVTNLHSRSSATRAGRKYLVFTDLFQVADRDHPPPRQFRWVSGGSWRSWREPAWPKPRRPAAWARRPWEGRAEGSS